MIFTPTELLRDIFFCLQRDKLEQVCQLICYRWYRIVMVHENVLPRRQLSLDCETFRCRGSGPWVDPLSSENIKNSIRTCYFSAIRFGYDDSDLSAHFNFWQQLFDSCQQKTYVEEVFF